MSSRKAQDLPPQEEESSELSRFRAEWKAELESRRRARATELQAAQAGGAGATPAPGPSTSTEVPFVFPVIRPKAQDSKAATAAGGSHPAITPDGRVVDQKRTKALDSALSVYRRAVQHEQAGDLDEALSLYRQAFRMVYSF